MLLKVKVVHNLQTITDKSRCSQSQEKLNRYAWEKRGKLGGGARGREKSFMAQVSTALEPRGEGLEVRLPQEKDVAVTVTMEQGDRLWIEGSLNPQTKKC